MYHLHTLIAYKHVLRLSLDLPYNIIYVWKLNQTVLELDSNIYVC
jgi:hypothetical protein